MSVDSLSGVDVFELQEQVKGSSWRAQRFKTVVNDADGLFLDVL